MIKKKKFNGAEFLRSWGITDPNKLKAGIKGLRYTNPPEKGVYWHYMSLWIRKRDTERYGECISCEKEITMENAQAGHFMPAHDCGRDLLFDPINLNAECGYCNAFDDTHLLGYAKNLDKRYGKGTADKLVHKRLAYKHRKEPVKDFKGHEYAEKIRELPTYKEAMKNLQTDSSKL